MRSGGKHFHRFGFVLSSLTELVVNLYITTPFDSVATSLSMCSKVLNRRLCLPKVQLLNALNFERTNHR